MLSVLIVLMAVATKWDRKLVWRCLAGAAALIECCARKSNMGRFSAWFHAAFQAWHFADLRQIDRIAFANFFEIQAFRGVESAFE